MFDGFHTSLQSHDPESISCEVFWRRRRGRRLERYDFTTISRREEICLPGRRQIKYHHRKTKDNDMEQILLIILIGLAGGVAVGLQSPLASMISQRLGVFESVFIVHIGGAVLALIPILIYSGGKLAQWRSLPWYALGAGIFGLVVIGAISYMIPRVGVAASITTIVAGQLLVGTILDHFGLLGAMSRSMDMTRVIGLVVVLVGVWLTVK
jgi:transporter family-2 protein